MRGGVRPLAVGVLLAWSLAGCGGEAEPTAAPSSDNPYAATATPETPVEMIAPPADYVVIDGKGYEIGAPREFQQQTSESSNGEPMLVLELPSSATGVPERVAVVREVDPQQAAVEQSFALETAKAAGGPESETTRIEMPAPEGQSAFLVRWRERVAGADGENVDTTYWQLMHQVSDALILNVVAFAPTADFATSEVSKVLRTFTPDAP